MSSSVVNAANPSGIVALSQLSICSFHSFHPVPFSTPLNSTKDEKRAISLDVFLDADKFSLIVNKKHRSVNNEVLLPELQEDVEENSWKCFGNSEVVSTRYYLPPKTTEKPASFSKDSAANKNSSVPLLIDTSIPPPSFRLPVVIDTSIPPPSFLTPPTSEPTSPSVTAEKPLCAFNVGVVNAPQAGARVAKKHLLDNEDAFEMIIDQSKPKKVKIFSPEEIRKQESLVNEWKRKIQASI